MSLPAPCTCGFKTTSHRAMKAHRRVCVYITKMHGFASAFSPHGDYQKKTTDLEGSTITVYRKKNR